MRPFMLRGNTVEEKLASAEMAIKHMRNRIAPQRVVVEYVRTGMGGWLPILGAIEGDVGEIKMLVPVGGTVVDIHAYCGSIAPEPGTNRKQALITVAVEVAPNIFETKSVLIGEGRSSAHISKEVCAGMRLRIFSNKPIVDFWYSFEIEPTTRSRVVDNPQLSLLEEAK